LYIDYEPSVGAFRRVRAAIEPAGPEGVPAKIGAYLSRFDPPAKPMPANKGDPKNYNKPASGRRTYSVLTVSAFSEQHGLKCWFTSMLQPVPRCEFFWL
jgi:hypothetical protein